MHAPLTNIMVIGRASSLLLFFNSIIGPTFTLRIHIPLIMIVALYLMPQLKKKYADLIENLKKGQLYDMR